MIVGMDTSCYTTSVALMQQSRLIVDLRRLLTVENRSRGLRQSEAVFQHIKNLPPLMEELKTALGGADIRGVAVSVKPRPVEGSYMPVFRAGEAAAATIAAAARCPLWPVSHQEGHLAAACWSLGMWPRRPFIAAHLSGGTGEILYVEPQDAGFAIQAVGSADLAPGQFVDRLGVAMGLPFPAGPALESLAVNACEDAFPLKAAVRGGDMSFSGPESAAQRALQSGVSPGALAKGIFVNIGASLKKALAWALAEYHCDMALVAGGVAGNSLVKAYLSSLPQALFAGPAYSGDNSVGVAYLGQRRLD
ncbi:MAG: O-sialoglycoprotein endopeptidase [Firmicutes bacterium]|nr:O-sialoglycoprotein endopeptidase [Bacillota bacterium]